MMKKTITIFFVLMANIIMLAHVVIPHHHHKSEICLEDSLLQSQSVEHSHSDNHLHDAECHINYHAQYNHDSKTDTDHNDRSNFCPLIQIEAILAKSLKGEISLISTERFTAVNLSEQTLIEDLNSSDFSKYVVSDQSPILKSSYLYYTNKVMGHRGPPSLV